MVEAFPFLVTTSAGTQRKAVVLPDFLKGEEAARLLVDASAPKNWDKEGEVYSLGKLPHSTQGPFHAIYRHRKATAADLGHEPDKLFPEHITEGFLVRGADTHTVGFAGPAINKGTPEERPWSFSTSAPPGAPKDFEYAKAHMDAASKAMRPKLREFAQAKEWTEARALSGVKLDLAANASEKLNIEAVAPDYIDLRRNWARDAEQAASRASAATERTAVSAGSWSERVGRSWERRLLSPNSNRELGFAAAAVVTLGAALAWRHWRNKHPETEQAQTGRA
jgi:hypothetical protein